MSWGGIPNLTKNLTVLEMSGEKLTAGGETGCWPGDTGK